MGFGRTGRYVRVRTPCSCAARNIRHVTNLCTGWLVGTLVCAAVGRFWRCVCRYGILACDMQLFLKTELGAAYPSFFLSYLACFQQRHLLHNILSPHSIPCRRSHSPTISAAVAHPPHFSSPRPPSPPVRSRTLDPASRFHILIARLAISRPPHAPSHPHHRPSSIRSPVVPIRTTASFPTASAFRTACPTTRFSPTPLPTFLTSKTPPPQPFHPTLTNPPHHLLTPTQNPFRCLKEGGLHTLPRSYRGQRRPSGSIVGCG